MVLGTWLDITVGTQYTSVIKEKKPSVYPGLQNQKLTTPSHGLWTLGTPTNV